MHDGLSVLVLEHFDVGRKSRQRMQHAKKHKSGFSDTERLIDAFDDVTVAPFQERLTLLLMALGNVGLAGAQGLEELPCPFVLFQQEFWGLGADERCALIGQLQKKLVIEAAGLGQALDDLPLVPAVRQPVLVKAHALPKQIQCRDLPADPRPHLLDALTVLLPLGLADFPNLQLTDGLTHRSQVRLGVNDGNPDQPPRKIRCHWDRLFI